MIPQDCLGGWINDPDAREQTLDQMAQAGHQLSLSLAAPGLFLADDTASVFLWEAEQQVLGKVLHPWNQNPIGACVGFGSTKAAQDTYLQELAAGEPEVWPGAEFAPEVTYVGSRNEAWPPNYSRLPASSDGSVGAAAARWLTMFGVVKRGVYGGIDLTAYNRDWTRANQGRGVPDEIEREARLRPIATAVRCNRFDDLWAGLGARKGAFFCSILGFAMAADAQGYARVDGEWGHCQAARGRFVHPDRGPSIVGCNSWLTRDGGEPIHPSNGPVTVQTVDRGPVTLPPGHVAYTKAVFDRIIAERDTYVLAGVTGWRPLTLSWNPLG